MSDNEQYKAYASELRSIVVKSNDLFEKQLNYISAGALGLSMLLIEKIIPNISESKYKLLLYLSWILLTGTLVSNLISHIYTSSRHSKTISEIEEGNYNNTAANIRNKRIGNWNLFSVILLLLGLLTLIFFVIKNL